MTNMKSRHLTLAMDAATPTERTLHLVAARAHGDAHTSILHRQAAQHATTRAFDPRVGGTELPAMDAGEFDEGKHKRADNGQFGSGGGKAEPGSPHRGHNISPKDYDKDTESLNGKHKIGDRVRTGGGKDAPEGTVAGFKWDHKNKMQGVGVKRDDGNHELHTSMNLTKVSSPEERAASKAKREKDKASGLTWEQKQALKKNGKKA